MTAISHKQLFPVFASASAEGRGTAFRENPCEETRDAIIDHLERSLNKLIRSAAKGPAKRTSAKPTAKATRETAVAKKTAGDKPKRNPLAREFPVGTRVRVIKRNGDKFVGVVEKQKINGANVRLKTGDMEYGRFTQMTALSSK